MTCCGRAAAAATLSTTPGITKPENGGFHFFSPLPRRPASRACLQLEPENLLLSTANSFTRSPPAQEMQTSNYEVYSFLHYTKTSIVQMSTLDLKDISFVHLWILISLLIEAIALGHQCKRFGWVLKRSRTVLRSAVTLYCSLIYFYSFFCFSVKTVYSECGAARLPTFTAAH